MLSGDIVREGYPIVFIEEAEVDVDHVSEKRKWILITFAQILPKRTAPRIYVG
ncbi:MAG: hypothetical protein Ct9H300mP8_09230 [Gammaproteobacteria bacterium]|nr:MAG: hypothetical protein Ct9H300mP8_09230 [Gammaproteobacteria bacterium]